MLEMDSLVSEVPCRKFLDHSAF